MKKNRKQWVTLRRLLAWALIFASLLTPTPAALAAEVNVPDVPAQQQEEGIVPYGSLSGYGQKYDTGTGSFTMTVNGSWSPFAGCTIRTEGFNSSTINEIRVYDESGNEKASATLTGNMDVRNLTMLNVSPGTYTVRYGMVNVSGGTIIVQIY